jgi:trehalose 6-phosphate synthase
MPTVVASNRGPLSFARDDSGALVARRGAGGLVSALRPLLTGTGATWVAAAATEEDRAATEAGLMDLDGIRLSPVAADDDTYRKAYDVVSNSTLWFLHHGLYDLPRRPRFDSRWSDAWSAYRRLNLDFAESIARSADPGSAVLVQDYHLALVGSRLSQLRPDLRAVHFTHTPFAGPSAIRVLPDFAASELMESMASYRACGFHNRRWALAFEGSCEEVTGRRPRTFVAPLGPDPEDLRRSAASAECAEAGRRLDEQLGKVKIVLRVDRVEPSKNLLRGFLAFDEMLGSHPELRERVVFLAFVYASREGLPEYLAYKAEVEALVERVNSVWSTPGWTPVLLDISDDYPRSVAALARYDVLLVNPVSDGLNLVAKEGPLLNARDGLLVLSREAGAWEEMAGGAIGVNPFDISATADAMAGALSAAPEERQRRARLLREAAARRTPKDWLEDQLAAADG